MKELNLQKIQNKLRSKFLKLGVNMRGPETIFFSAVDYDSGEKANLGNKKAIIESFKNSDINKLKNNELEISGNYDKLIKFRQFY